MLRKKCGNAHFLTQSERSWRLIFVVLFVSLSLSLSLSMHPGGLGRIAAARRAASPRCARTPSTAPERRLPRPGRALVAPHAAAATVKQDGTAVTTTLRLIRADRRQDTTGRGCLESVDRDEVDVFGDATGSTAPRKLTKLIRWPCWRIS